MLPYAISRFKSVRENIPLSSVDQDNASELEPEVETGNRDDSIAEDVLPIDEMWYKNHHFLLVMSTRCRRVSTDGMYLHCLLMR